MLGKLQVHDPLDLQRLVPGTWGLEVLGTWELTLRCPPGYGPNAVPWPRPIYAFCMVY